LGECYLDQALLDKAQEEFEWVRALHWHGANQSSPAAQLMGVLAQARLAILNQQWREAERLLLQAEEQQVLTSSKVVLPEAMRQQLKQTLYSLYTLWAQGLLPPQGAVPSVASAQEAFLMLKKANGYLQRYSQEQALHQQMATTLAQLWKAYAKAHTPLAEQKPFLEETLGVHYAYDTVLRVAQAYEAQALANPTQPATTQRMMDWYEEAYRLNPYRLSLKWSSLLVAQAQRLQSQGQQAMARVYFTQAKQVAAAYQRLHQSQGQHTVLQALPLHVKAWGFAPQGSQQQTPWVWLAWQGAGAPPSYLRLRLQWLKEKTVVLSLPWLLNEGDWAIDTGRKPLYYSAGGQHTLATAPLQQAPSLTLKVFASLSDDSQAPWQLITEVTQPPKTVLVPPPAAALEGLAFGPFGPLVKPVPPALAPGAKGAKPVVGAEGGEKRTPPGASSSRALVKHRRANPAASSDTPQVLTAPPPPAVAPSPSPQATPAPEPSAPAEPAAAESPVL
jgi:hypothetical protein